MMGGVREDGIKEAKVSEKRREKGNAEKWIGRSLSACRREGTTHASLFHQGQCRGGGAGGGRPDPESSASGKSITRFYL